MALTYEPLATTTLGSSQATITFSSISGTYTDLRVILTCTTTSNATQVWVRFNSDTTSTYSFTYLSGDGTSASSGTAINQTKFEINQPGGTSTTVPTFYTLDVFSYAGSTNKSSLATASEDKNGSGTTQNAIGLWRSTNAITSIELSLSTGSFATGSTATLYGIKKA